MSVRARIAGSLDRAGKFPADAAWPLAAAAAAAYDDGRGRRGQGLLVTSLTELEMRILAFERSWWRSPGAKEREILDALGMSPTRYYQLLNELIDRPAAAQFDPALVARLRRRRAVRARLRSGREG